MIPSVRVDRRRLLLLAAGATTLPASAEPAPPPEVAALWAEARRIGSGRQRLLGLTIFDARLWSPFRPTPADWWSRPFALELVYARALTGSRIAERSLREMRRQADIDADQAERWQQRLRATFPDVQPGDRLTGIHHPDGPARFHFNAAPAGDWSDPRLQRLFFGIWLGPETSEPDLRRALFGGQT